MAASCSSDWALNVPLGSGEPPFHRINTQGRADSSTPGPVARGPVQLQVRVDLQLDIQSLVAVCHFLQSVPNPEKRCPWGQPETGRNVAAGSKAWPSSGGCIPGVGKIWGQLSRNGAASLWAIVPPTQHFKQAGFYETCRHAPGISTQARWCCPECPGWLLVLGLPPGGCGFQRA